MVETEFGRKTNRKQNNHSYSQLNNFHGLLNVEQISFRLWFLCELNSIYCLLAERLWVEQLMVFNRVEFQFESNVRCIRWEPLDLDILSVSLNVSIDNWKVNLHCRWFSNQFSTMLICTLFAFHSLSRFLLLSFCLCFLHSLLRLTFTSFSSFIFFRSAVRIVYTSLST